MVTAVTLGEVGIPGQRVRVTLYSIVACGARRTRIRVAIAKKDRNR